MLPIPALITREPRPVERSVARRRAAVVHEPKAAGGWSGPPPPDRL
jgi:hypothetical protein